ncbi:MAG: RNA 2',3'-cyclic phosphodiesterase [Candidatus Pacearchaeota archaeon]|nr:MAG: RNA 2',3'-cyclic phosphodiesterase [Candidatus Pacearchaeota archaeon]
MRCFIAIDIPSEVREELARAEEVIRGFDKRAKLKIVEPENLHITIKFLGDLTDDQVNKAKEVLREIKFEPFKVKLNSFGIFPSLNFIRVVWVDVLPKEQLIELEKKIDDVISEKLGFRRNRNFETHITLARAKYIGDKQKFVEGLKNITVSPIEFEIKNFSLKKSTLTREGPIYEDIIKF